MTQSPETYNYGSSLPVAHRCPPTPCYDYDGSYYNPSNYGSGVLYKRKRRSFAADAKPIGKLDRNGNSASYGYSFSKNDQCYSDYSTFAIYPNSSSYDYDCPDFSASYDSFSDNSYFDGKITRTSPMGIFINGVYVNYGCLYNYYSSSDDDTGPPAEYNTRPPAEYDTIWQYSSSFTDSFNSDNFYGPPSSSNYGSYLPILGGGYQI